MLKMTSSSTKLQEKIHEPLVYCPVTSKQVRVRDREQFSILGGQASWWRCPECLGWHVAFAKDNGKYSSRMN